MKELDLPGASWTSRSMNQQNQILPQPCWAGGYHYFLSFVLVADAAAGDVVMSESYAHTNGGCTQNSGNRIWDMSQSSAQLTNATYPALSVGSHIAFYDHVSARFYQMDFNSMLMRSFTRAGQWQSSSFLILPNVPWDCWYWDSVRRVLVLAELSTPSPTIWEMSIANNFWVERNIAPSGFVPRQGMARGFDPSTGIAVFFGGQTAAGQLRNDVWHYDGASFYQVSLATSPVSRRGAAMAYHPPSQSLIMWGGSNGNTLLDTWRYRPATQTVSYSTYGTGCVGTAGTPSIAAVPGALPYAGQTFVVNVTNIPWFAPTFMVVGFSDTSWNGNPLPVDLGVIGMPNCTVRASVDWLMPTTSVLGVAAWSIQIPSSFAGNTFYNQAVVFDPAANTMGLTLSNARKAIVGY
jgi:hypothetical protein